MRIFNAESPLMEGLSKVADLVILNLLVLLCCIPVITDTSCSTLFPPKSMATLVFTLKLLDRFSNYRVSHSRGEYTYAPALLSYRRN